MPLTYHILIADDHSIIRRGLKFILDAHFTGCYINEAGTIKDVKNLLSSFTFSHLIFDMQMLDDNIIEHLPEIKKQYPLIPILIYTMSPEEIYGKRMLDMGATGFLSKQSSETEVIEALDMFLKGKTYISKQLKEKITKDDFKFNSESPIESLSDRELIVMNYILKGTGVKEISLKLDLKPTTIATYKARIFNKLGVSNIMDMRNVLDVYKYTSS